MGFPTKRAEHDSPDPEGNERLKEHFLASEASADKDPVRRPTDGALDLLLAERTAQTTLADGPSEWI